MGSTKLMIPAVEVALASDPGRDPSKQVNEDCCRHAATAFGHLIVLCDGMGGHESGSLASLTAVDAVFRHVDAAPLRPDIPPAVRVREVLRDAIAVANRAVHALGATRPSARPGSTVVAVLVHSLGTEVAHVGDSRCYLASRGTIRQLTRDHSTVQEMVDAGKLSAEEAARHPDANQITRALGASEGVEVDVLPSSVPHEEGDVLVLCSDGLSDLVPPADILAATLAEAPAAAARRLVDLANERGGHDNVTVAIVRARESALVPREAASSPAAFRMTEAVPQQQLAPLVAQPRERLLPPGPASSPRRPRRALPWIVAGALVIVAAGIAAVYFAASGDDAARGRAARTLGLPSAALEPTPPDPGDTDAGERHRGRPRRR